MKLGFASISALDRPLADAARVARGAGCDGLEVTERPPHFPPDATPAAAREAGRCVREAGLEVIAFGSYLGREVLRPGDATRAAACAEAMEAPLLRVWAEPAVGERAAAVAMLQTVCDAAAAAGIGVVVERHVGSHADTPERVEALLEDVGRNNFALNYQVLDALPEAAIDTQPEDAARLVASARYFHLKNYRRNPDGGPLLPGGSLETGTLDCRAILAAAWRAGYDGPHTIEFLSWEPLPLEEKLARDVKYVKALHSERGAR